MIKAVLFDVNGVFLQSEKLSERFQKDFSVDAGEFFSALKDMLKICRKPNAPSVYDCMKPYFDKMNIPFTEQEFYDYWFGGERLVPELLDYAKELKTRGFKIFIFSNNLRERTNYYHSHFPELFSFFNRTYFSWETGFVKSDIRAYKNVLVENNLQPEECIFFDDSPENIELAKSLGIKAQKYEGLESTKNFIDSLTPQISVPH